MPVNLLPQTPPQTTGGAKTQDAPDEGSASSFVATLSAARGARMPGEVRPARGAADAKPVDAANVDRDASAAADAVEALALLGWPGLVAVASTTIPATAKPALDSKAMATQAGPAVLPEGVAGAARAAPDSVAEAALANVRAAPEEKLAATKIFTEAAAPKIGAESERASAHAAEPLDWREAFSAAVVASAVPSTADTQKTTAAALREVSAALAKPSVVKDQPDAAVAPMSAPAASTPPVQIEIATPALTPGWREEVVDRMTQLVVLRQDHAEIRIHPENLGPISVQIQFDGNQANLLIQAPQPATRDALDLALPQLRDALAEQGITLGQASVHDDRRPPSEQSREAPDAQVRSASSVAGVEGASAPLRRASVGLVDLFA